MLYRSLKMSTLMLVICISVLVGKTTGESTIFPLTNTNCSDVDSESNNDSFVQIDSQTKNCGHKKKNPPNVPAALPSLNQHNMDDNLADQADSPSTYYTSNSLSKVPVKNQNELDIWQCLMRQAKAIRLEEQTNQKFAKTIRFCSSTVRKGNGRDIKNEKGPGTYRKEDLSAGDERYKDDCLPLLIFLFPILCNETRLCINFSEASLDTISQRFWLWNRKKTENDKGSEAVIYIVVVLAFYSFGIVFMMANFIRQEQRELEETKLYKQYVKVARDRLLTSRGNMANKLALQALNTFNAVPQTTDDSKITFV